MAHDVELVEQYRGLRRMRRRRQPKALRALERVHCDFKRRRGQNTTR
jgi:hypothetical protein